MPLIDHFGPLITRFHTWRTVHFAWPAMMASELNLRQLPPEFVAQPIDWWQHARCARVGITDVRYEIPRLVAAVEIAGPPNRSRAARRRVFAGKCAAAVAAGGLVVIDPFPGAAPDLHGPVLAAIGAPPHPHATPWALWARGTVERGTVSLAVGRTLPTLPLWIGRDTAVPLDLESTYVAACTAIGLHRAG